MFKAFFERLVLFLKLFTIWSCAASAVCISSAAWVHLPPQQYWRPAMSNSLRTCLEENGFQKFNLNIVVSIFYCLIPDKAALCQSCKAVEHSSPISISSLDFSGPSPWKKMSSPWKDLTFWLPVHCHIDPRGDILLQLSCALLLLLSWGQLSFLVGCFVVSLAPGRRRW